MRCAPLLFYGLLTAGGHLSSIRMSMAPNQRMQYGLINERMASIVAAAASHRARAKTAFRMGDKATALRLLKLAKQCDAECAAEAATLSSDFALAAERASTGSNRIEQQLIEQATPIAASPDSNAAAEALKSFGVSRVDGVLDVSACAELKSHILKLREEAADPTSQRWAIWMGAADNRYVPGSRVKFAAALEEKLTTTRSDLLLPLEDAVVADALRTALSSLKAVLVDGSASLPAEFDGSGDGDHGDDCAGGGEPAGEGAGGGCGLPEALQELELVECGALIAKPGAEHQALHADYRRRNILMTSGAPPDGSASSPAESRPAMPPRLVAFVYLQDVPTYLHGPTVFLPGTANAGSHDAILEENGAVKPGALQRRGPEWMATVKAGDAVVYDASVLHYGSANSVAGNERVVFYFGVSRKGHANSCAGPPVDGWSPAEPVRLWDYC